MADLQLFEDLIADITARLHLRDPNRDAIQTLSAEVSQYYDIDGKHPPFEAVIDVATGVGKTYILAGAIDLFSAAYGVSDFVIITPGRTILEKTRDNFAPGHPKCLLGPMNCQPVVVTAENFNTPAMRAVMDDDSQIKVYLFTVQSVIKPNSRVGRKTHKFQEGLGTEFYEHLKALGQLVVFADEHHCYYSPAFSKAIRDLDPWLLVGLTATPHKQTPKEQIIFRYPLAAAIADQLVKTPVIVGRRDDRTDDETKLIDGVTLLRTKAEAIDACADPLCAEPVNPVMLVVAKNIAEADEYAAILRSNEFFGGAYADAVLVVHSSAPDTALEELAEVEQPESPVRIIISVGMLKEGWDVRNVYVIASMRSSVSEILTEQTLGRGMRLAFGRYTGIEILDTLEVIAHERYHDLLQKAGVLNQAFVDYRTRAALRTNAQGQRVVVKEHVITSARAVIPNATHRDRATQPDDALSPAVTTTEERTRQADVAAKSLKQQVERRTGSPSIRIPILRITNLRSRFSLADITSDDAFRRLGAQLAADPDGELNRTVISARVVTGPDGVKHTELITADAADHVRSQPRLFPLDDMRDQLTDYVLASPAVPARPSERRAFEPLLSAFLGGLGDKAEMVLSANLGRAAARLIKLVEQEQRRFMAKPTCEEIVEFKEFNPLRVTDKPESRDRHGAFSTSVAYGDWKRCMYALAWFDSRPERTVANMVDSSLRVASWARLHIGDIPLLWNANRRYNPDLLVVETNGTHWLVEVKMDKEMDSCDVLAKREAAVRWANHVTSKAEIKEPWRYLLVSETDVNTAKNSWDALKQLGQGQ